MALHCHQGFCALEGWATFEISNGVSTIMTLHTNTMILDLGPRGNSTISVNDLEGLIRDMQAWIHAVNFMFPRCTGSIDRDFETSLTKSTSKLSMTIRVNNVKCIDIDYVHASRVITWRSRNAVSVSWCTFVDLLQGGMQLFLREIHRF